MHHQALSQLLQPNNDPMIRWAAGMGRWRRRAISLAPSLCPPSPFFGPPFLRSYGHIHKKPGSCRGPFGFLYAAA